MFSYRSLLRQAWEITWRYKYLWFFGLFATLVAGGGSWEYQILTQNLNQSMIDGSYFRLSGILALGEIVKNFFIGLASLFQYDIWTIINVLSILLVSLFLLAFFVWLAVVCQAALIGDVKKIVNSKRKDLALSIQEGLTAGHRHFWSVLSLNLLTKVLISFLLLIASFPLLFMVISDTAILATSYVVLFVIFIPLAMGLSLMIKYAIAYRILDDKSFISSIEASEKLFRKNWLISLEAAVILFVINFLASGVLLIIMALILLPLLLLGLIFQLGWLITLTILLAIAILVIFGSALTTFQTATWTNLFLVLKDKGGLAKLERIFRRGN
jgi:hypothetical protein